MLGGDGDDTLRANDNEADVVDGGPGYDRAYVDKWDEVTNVERRL